MTSTDSHRGSFFHGVMATLAIIAMVASTGFAQATAVKGYEYAAKETTLPFAYSATVSTAARPISLDFTDELGENPDNCQVLVRIDGELWQFKNRLAENIEQVRPPSRYAGPDIDHMLPQADATLPPGYQLGWFLGGMWYDKSESKLYAPMHIEAESLNRDGPIAPWPARKIILATSTDKGKTWRDEGDIIAPETYFYIKDAYKFSGSYYSNGLCDYGFYADIRGGYFYIFPMEGWFTKGTWDFRWSARAARCAISDKMAPGKWTFFYNGEWSEPGLGGRSSVIAPALWPVMYNTYLKKYIGLFPSGGSGFGDLKKQDGIYLGTCTDLSRQDWQYVLFSKAHTYEFMNLMNAEGNDITTCGQNVRVYFYGAGNTFQRIDVTFKEGQTTAPSVRPRYTFEAHPESSDSIQSRHTRFVGPLNGDVTYEGSWSDQPDPLAYEGHFKECATSGSATLSFKGSAVYWRALLSPDSGKADIYIDGNLRKTVDCYSPQSTDYEQIVYILTGLSPAETHTIKVVVRGGKNTSSQGTAIRHIGFEYTAESYKASAGFSSLRGKNNWDYLEGDREMRFCESIGVLMNYWSGEGRSRIGPDTQIPENAPVIREWRAPHGGTVRVEGRISLAQTGGPGARASIAHNSIEVWPSRLITPDHPAAQDFTVKVEQGDVLRFAVGKEATDATVEKVIWDPVITYTDSRAPVWTPNPPCNRNLARGKYARSKRLWHRYQPFNAVDGSADSAFVISDDDKISSGEDWLMVDLDQTTLIDHYVVLSVPPNVAWRPSAFRLQKSDDGLSWTDIDAVAKMEHDRIERAVPAFKARYVRLYLPKGKPFSINEFELYYTAGKPVIDESKSFNLR